jgi:predicted RNA-binding Zn ribbon-like protein
MSEDVVPPAVRLVRDFVNTYEPQVDEETLRDADALASWLEGEGLLPAGRVDLSESDLDDALVLREGLRNVLLENAGHESDARAIRALNDVLIRVPLRAEFGSGFQLVSTRADPLGQALGSLLEAVRQATEAGAWPRLKVCARDTCRWAFYDTSRNQTRRWCSMAGCGNHVKNQRAYAARKVRVATRRA